MFIIVCLDDRDGILFNGRRQSRDEVLCQRVLSISAHSKLWMNTYSTRLFDAAEKNICTSEDFLNQAQKGEYCFVENSDIAAHINEIEQVIVFRWNRTYPFDITFPFHLFPDQWNRTVVDSFPGKSHEKITMEVYRP